MPVQVSQNLFWHPASFLTLTYPGRSGWRPEYEKPEVCKRHLKAWWTRFQREFPGAWGFWVIEQQQRRTHPELPPAWHYHLLVVWPSPNGDPEDKDEWHRRLNWVSNSWAKVVAGRGCRADADHENAGTRVDRVVTIPKLREYMRKGGARIDERPEPQEDVPMAAAVGARELVGATPAVTAVHELRARMETPPVNWPGRRWGILGRKFYTRERSVPMLELDSITAQILGQAIQRNWWRYANRRNFAFEFGPPTWIEGRHAEQVLREVGMTPMEALARSVKQ